LVSAAKDRGIALRQNYNRLSGTEAYLGSETLEALGSIPGVVQVVAASAFGWAAGSFVRKDVLPDSWNEGIGNGEVAIMRFFGYKP
jgi:hypothetical protein